MIQNWDECCYADRSGQAGEMGQQKHQGRCQVLHLEENNPLCHHRLRTDELERSFDKKTSGGPGGWGDHEPASCIYSRGQQPPCLHQEECCQQPGRFHLSLLSPDERHLEYCAQSWVLQHKWDMNILEWVKYGSETIFEWDQQSATMIKRLKHLSLKERLRDLCVEKFQGDLITVCK